MNERAAIGGGGQRRRGRSSFDALRRDGAPPRRGRRPRRPPAARRRLHARSTSPATRTCGRWRRSAPASCPGPEMSIAQARAHAEHAADRADCSARCSDRASSPTPASGAPTPGRSSCSASPAMRVAGGTDEIMRNIVGERVLGLPEGATRARATSRRPSEGDASLRATACAGPPRGRRHGPRPRGGRLPRRLRPRPDAARHRLPASARAPPGMRAAVVALPRVSSPRRDPAPAARDAIDRLTPRSHRGTPCVARSPSPTTTRSRCSGGRRPPARRSRSVPISTSAVIRDGVHRAAPPGTER